MMKKKFRLPGSTKGQSLVEFAISLVILLWILSGIVEFAIALFQYIQLRDAAQEGALYGSINPKDYAGIETRTRAASNSPVDLAISGTNGTKVRVYVDNVLTREDGVNTGATVQACETHALKVIVSYNHKIFMPFMKNILNRTTISLSAEVIDTILTPAPLASGACPP
ncbi:MAG TPA: TadE/TadG family type IV pilus assembly protein [Anaerolineales bacterium]|nr:TadE/TadG family type IV pilus assembly protein [Anaerolineales bacterium]